MPSLDNTNQAEPESASGWSLLRPQLPRATGKKLDVFDLVKSKGMQSRKSFVSSGTGLTPRMEDIEESSKKLAPQRLKHAAGANVLGTVAASDAMANGKWGDALPPNGIPKPLIDAPLSTEASEDEETYVLNNSDWRKLLSGARYRRYTKEASVLQMGKPTDGMLQVVSGTLRVELPQTDRPQNVVVGRLGQGDILGEAGLLLGTPPSAMVVCDSEEAMVLRLPRAHLAIVFLEHPALAARFFCTLAVRMCARLRKVNEQEIADVETNMSKNVNAPQTMTAVSANPAFFHILHKFVLATPRYAAVFTATFNLIQESRLLLNEPDTERLSQMVHSLYELHIARDAPKVPVCLTDEARAEVTTKLARMSAAGNAPHAWRHVLDTVVDQCMQAIEEACFKAFLQSRHYQYVLMLKSKELVVPTMDWFRVVSVLGKGGFGQVCEVIKRDCNYAYAMKIQKKTELMDVFGDVWEMLALTERRLLASLVHPLLVNLAYAFQTIDKIVLVMDACPNGDLSRFGMPREEKPRTEFLSKRQLFFVSIEVASVLLYLHEQKVIYRDMKPANLLLDAGGHVRLIDFGVSKQAKPTEAVCTSRECCGTGGYMAPDVALVETNKIAYSYAVDWYSFGVVVYELADHQMPYGENPPFVSIADEFREPQLLDEYGEEIEHLYDLLAGLLDWDPVSRIGDHNIKTQPYWADADWELADRGRLPSPYAPAPPTRPL